MAETFLAWCLGICAAIVGSSIVLYLYSSQKEAKRERELEERRQEQAIRNREQAIKDFSLNCEDCGALAAPIPSTNNRYRCDKCGRQFASSPHPC